MIARRNLLLSGGPGHDFAETSALLAGHLSADGIDTTVVDDPDEAAAVLAAEPDGWDLVTVNALRWRMLADRYAPERDRWAFTIGPGHERAFGDHVRGGGGLLALHTAVICFDPSRRWHELVGGSWDWSRSNHGPLGPVEVTVTAAGAAHPVTREVGGFTVVDEVYRDLDLGADVEPLAVAIAAGGGSAHPVVWARQSGSGRVVTDLLGHGPASVGDPSHAVLLRAGARWACRSRPDSRPDRRDDRRDHRATT